MVVDKANPYVCMNFIPDKTYKIVWNLFAQCDKYKFKCIAHVWRVNKIK